MATDKQIAANRRNAQKATGPKSAEGKFKSSLNALRLGLYSHTFIIKTEDEQVFQNFSAGFIDEFKPQTPSELELLEQLISIAWRRHRLAGLINQRVNNAINTVAAQCAHTVTPTETAPNPAAPLDPIHITLLAYERLEDEKPSFARQEAQETRLCSLFQRTLSRLQQSRKITEPQKIRNETNFDLNALHRAI